MHLLKLNWIQKTLPLANKPLMKWGAILWMFVLQSLHLFFDLKIDKFLPENYHSTEFHRDILVQLDEVWQLAMKHKLLFLQLELIDRPLCEFYLHEEPYLEYWFSFLWHFLHWGLLLLLSIQKLIKISLWLHSNNSCQYL